MDDNRQFLLELYRQSWHQARHNEILRAGFTAVYAVIVAGTLSLLAQSQHVHSPVPVWILVALSIMGIFVSCRIRSNAQRWTRTQRMIQKNLQIRDVNLQQYLAEDSGGVCLITGNSGKIKWLAEFVRIDMFYIVMYAIATVVLILIALNILPFLE